MSTSSIHSSSFSEDGHSISDSEEWESESESSYDSHTTEDGDEQTIEAQRLVAIGVLQEEAKPPPQEQDEIVANRIAREEHITKMRIKEEREAVGKPRAKRIGATRAEQEREAKMQTFKARRGVPRSRPQRGNAKPKAEEEESLETNSNHQGTIASNESSQQSFSSGIDLDEKTRQRIISRSAMRYANQRAAAAAASRPSDDKRNLRISPKFTSNTQRGDASGVARLSRPSDEKAAFRRRPRRARTARNDAQAGKQDSDSLEEISTEIIDTAVDENNNAENSQDLEAQQVFEEDQPEVLPGAFAVSGIGDDEDGQGNTGYDSGFENDDDIGEEEEAPQPLEGDVETGSDAMMDVSTAINAPLTAELVEEEKAVAAISAKVVLNEEDEDEIAPVKMRKLSIQITIAFFVMLVIAGTIVGVLLRRGVGETSQVTEQDNTPKIGGWTVVGDVLTVEDPYKDNIRFGNAVAISQDGNRIAVGLPGLDDAEDGIFRSVGSVQIFDLVNGTIWKTNTELFGAHSNAELGTNVALSDDGKRLAVGAPSYNSDESGYVAIYEELNDQWTLAVNFSSQVEGGVFGDAVGFAGDGSVIAIGDKYAKDRGLDNVGAIQVYREVNGAWLPMGNRLVGSTRNNLFGWSISVSQDGSRVATSSLGGNMEPGSVQVFDFNGTSWETAGSRLIGESTRESFGVSVELSRDGAVVAVSATDFSREGQEDGVGVVRSYRWNENDWEPYGQPLEGENKLDAFGSSVSLSNDGSTIAIGGPENGNFCDNCGHIKVFSNDDGESWNTVGTALGKTDIDNGQFGYAVALSATGDRVVGAAPFTKFDGFFSKVGQVLVFDSTVNEG